ncbi:helix-turn-helix domain-containing protein [Anaeromyxobacter sp. Red801]|uniref:helix-turn-helix domain-containing protein n=1 Tax=Anaeromyxobacter sp. Red801 TaxID=3411632 RepID=UPI003BA18B4D
MPGSRRATSEGGSGGGRRSQPLRPRSHRGPRRACGRCFARARAVASGSSRGAGAVAPSAPASRSPRPAPSPPRASRSIEARRGRRGGGSSSVAHRVRLRRARLRPAVHTVPWCRQKDETPGVAGRSVHRRLERETGFEPASLSLGNGSPLAPGVHSGSQGLGDAGAGDRPDVQPSHPADPRFRHFATRLLPGHEAIRESDALLTVREVARSLRVSTATVYKMCASGALSRQRVLNVIRVPARAVAELLASRRSGLRVGGTRRGGRS